MKRLSKFLVLLAATALVTAAATDASYAMPPKRPASPTPLQPQRPAPPPPPHVPASTSHPGAAPTPASTSHPGAAHQTAPGSSSGAAHAAAPGSSSGTAHAQPPHGALSVEDFRKLSAEQIKDLSPDQIPALSKQQELSLKRDQRNALRGVKNRDEIAAREQKTKQKNLRQETVHRNVQRASDGNFTFLDSSKKHLLDGGGIDKDAKITLQQAKNLIKTSKPEEIGKDDRDPSATKYRVLYDPSDSNLSIQYSTRDEGNTITIFHIGPGRG